MFTRTHAYQSLHSKETLKKRLVGDHVKIHGLDFEVVENDNSISIVPHAEQVVEIKTLPETLVEMRETDGKTNVVIVSKMRQLDQGGPMLVLILCALLLIVSVIVYLFFETKNHIASYIIAGAFILIFSFFWIRLKMGYFDYVHKIREHVKSKEHA